MKKILLTGATGVMGRNALFKFMEMENNGDFLLRVLARESEKNHNLLDQYADRIEIIWGDLRDDEILREAVKDMDIVMHVGVYISPKCDDDPFGAFATNYASTLSMLKSIKELGQAETTHFLYIGSCAMFGDRAAPIHWGRVGDPLKPAVYDYYAISKTKSEYAVLESGLKYVASVRLGAMFRSAEGVGLDPISCHYNINQVLEWTDKKDAGNLLRNIALYAPEEFWGKVYNISSGPEWRLSFKENNEYSGVDYKAMINPEWQALHNFHGLYYLDADKLNEIVPFRTRDLMTAVEEDRAADAKMMQELLAQNPDFKMPTGTELNKMLAPLITDHPRGPLYGITHNDEDNIKVWFGSREKFEALPRSWDDYIYAPPSKTEPGKPLSLGFDECKPVSELDIEDMKGAAAFRGGECLSETMTKGDMYTPLRWKSADGYEFEARPYTVLFAGHWSPDDLRRTWRYGHIAKENPFFNQVWEPLHASEDDDYEIKMIADGSVEEAKYGVKF